MPTRVFQVIIQMKTKPRLSQRGTGKYPQTSLKKNKKFGLYASVSGSVGAEERFVDFGLRFFVLLLLSVLRQADAAAGRAAALAERAVGTCVLPEQHDLLLHI